MVKYNNMNEIAINIWILEIRPPIPSVRSSAIDKIIRTNIVNKEKKEVFLRKDFDLTRSINNKINVKDSTQKLKISDIMKAGTVDQITMIEKSTD